MKRTVYLAGPIAGLTEGEAKDWRSDVSERLLEHNIMGISPLRCEPATDGRYDISTTQNGDNLFGTAQAIGSKNEFDARNADMILVYLPSPSIGTIIELGWGKALNTPTVVVTDDPGIKLHPVIRHCSSWSLDTLDEAVDVIIGVLGDYAR